MPYQRTFSGLSRRDVLVATGVAVSGVTGLSRTVNGEPSASVTVARDRTLAPVSEDLDETLRRNDVALSVSTVSTEKGFERFLSRDVDVFHAVRPMLPDEAATAPTAEYEAFESVDGTALLRSPERWRSMLSTEQLDTLRGSNASQTWTELVPSDASVDLDPPAVESDGADAFEATKRPETVLPTDNTKVIVRGIRADQYAKGHGGLGYYEVLSEELTTAEKSTDRSSESLVGRLRYTYVDAHAASEEGVASFIQLFGRHARRRLAGVVPFADETTPLRTFDDHRSSM
ncbi:hypothetical protein [Halocatena salina]|uniref:Uncharacterized protein n=1 Tax=Halocatena salina TaxID=2934340 RepID=A0A8U0A465_9EURY|nr:hypothetical protein [Halocatena salina]UPM42717.1 hypothetical protein MW046_12250 [Halocatena salina]